MKNNSEGFLLIDAIISIALILILSSSILFLVGTVSGYNEKSSKRIEKIYSSRKAVLGIRYFESE